MKYKEEMPVERKNRPERGLRRIFERSLLELKTDAHLDGEDRPGSPVPRTSSQQAEGTHPTKRSSPQQSNNFHKIHPDPLEESSATADEEHLIQMCTSEANLVSDVSKDQGALMDSGKKLLSQGDSKAFKKMDDLKTFRKTEEEDASLNTESSSSNQVKETVAEKDKRGKSKKSKQRPTEKEESERHRRLSQKKSQQELKEDTSSRRSLDQSGKESRGSRKQSTSSQSHSNGKSRERGGSSSSKQDRKREESREKGPKSRLERPRERKERDILPKQMDISRCTDAKDGVSERSGFGRMQCIGEDWMSELLNLPAVDETKIIDKQDVLESEAQKEELYTTEQPVSCELGHIETVCKKTSFPGCEQKGSVTKIWSRSEENKDVNNLTNSLKELAGSQEAPHITACVFEEKVCFEKQQWTVMDTTLETIEEQSETSSWNEMDVGTIHSACDLQGIENEFFHDGWVERGQNEVLEQSEHDESTKFCEEITQVQREDRIAKQISKECVTTESGDFMKEGITKDGESCVENQTNQENIDTDHSEEIVSDKGKHKEDCFKGLEYTNTLAGGDSGFVGSISNYSSLGEELGCEDEEENSDTYQNLLKDRIVALEGRISTKPCFGPRGLALGNRSRGKHRHGPSPYQLYLKTIHFRNETEQLQHSVCAVASAESGEIDMDVNSKSKTNGECDEKLLLDNVVLQEPQEESLDSGSVKITPKTGIGYWPRRPPGFFTNPHPVMCPVVASSDAWFGDKVINDMKAKEILHKSDSDKITESVVEVQSLPNDQSVLPKQKELSNVKDNYKAEKHDTEGENWEDNLYDVEELELMMSKSQTSDAAAVVPSDTVVCERLNDDLGLEQCVPEEPDALTSSMESINNALPSSSLCNSQNTLSGVPTISEDENSVKDDENNSQHENSLESGIHQNIYKAVLQESSEKYNLETEMDYSNNNLNEKIEGTSNASDIVYESRGNYNNGLKCQCSPDFVQYWLWRSCLCQAPYLCSIQSGIDGQNISNRAYVYPVDQNNNAARAESSKQAIDDVLTKWKMTGFLKSAATKKSQTEKGGSIDVSGNFLNDKGSGREELKKESSDSRKSKGENDRQSTHCRLGKRFEPPSRDWDRESTSFDTVVHDYSEDVEDSETLDLAGGDSGDEYLVDTGATNSQTSEGTDNLPDSHAARGARSNVHYQQQTVYPPLAPTLNYAGYPPNYNLYPPHQTAGYSGTGVGLGRGYPSQYPDPYYPYPPMYVSDGYSVQPFVDGQVYPEHPAYPSPMYIPFYLMASGWREMSLHHRDSHPGSFPGYQHGSSQYVYEGQECSGVGSRRDVEAGKRDARHADDRHGDSIRGRLSCTKKDIEETKENKTSPRTEESGKNYTDKYIPPHKRISSVRGQSKNMGGLSNFHGSHRYRNSDSQLQSSRENRIQCDYALNQGSAEVEHRRTGDVEYGRGDVEYGRSGNLECRTLSENVMYPWSKPWEHFHSAQSSNRPLSSLKCGVHQSSRKGLGSPIKTDQGVKVLEKEPSCCDLHIAPSSTESTPTSGRSRLGRFLQELDTSSGSVHSDWKTAFLERCSDYGVGYLDSHCHIDFLFNRHDFRGKWSDFINQNAGTFPPSYLGCVAVFCNPNSFKSEGLWKSLSKEDNVWLAFGCHPKNARDFGRRSEDGLLRCLKNERVVALGEIGLDYSGSFIETKELQKTVFKKQIQIALEMKKPLVIHCRDAERDCLDILKQMVPRDYKIHCHCFTGDFTAAKLWLEHFPNLYIGLTPLVTYRTATGARDVAKFIPLSRLLLESDAPYFVPKTIPKEAMNFSHPGLCVTVAEEVAWLKNIPVPTVLEACLENTKDMYGI